MDSHDRDLAAAFDAQAPLFERAPVQSDPAALSRLVAFADLPPGARVLDAGCGPGLVAEAFLESGCEVQGVDLSAEMVRRARERCRRFGERASFHEVSVFELQDSAPFDASVSRYVLHHIVDPTAFARRQASLVRSGGILVASDHVADADPESARWHQEIECARDRTHVANLTPGAMVDLFGGAGIRDISLAEEPFDLDFDEWFDRGTPLEPKESVRARLLAGRSRGFWPEPLPGGAVRIHCLRVLVRGVKQ